MTKRLIHIALLIFATSAVLILLSVATYFFFQFERATVTEGEYLGLTIGETKEVVYQKVGPAISRTRPADSRIFIEIEVTGKISNILGVQSGHHAMVETRLTIDGFENLKGSDQWKFYIGASYMNILTLRFCDDRLCEIRRMKKPFEFP